MFLTFIFLFIVHYICLQISNVGSQDFSFRGIYIVPDITTRYRVQLHDTEALHIAGFIPGLKTIVVIHGFGVTGLGEWNITTGLIQAGVQANFFHVFWGAEAKQGNFPPPDRPLAVTIPALLLLVPNYFEVVFAVPKIAQAVAEFLVWLREIDFVKSKDIHIIGHSLGAHMAGEIANDYKVWSKGERIGRISGLDPAGPLYTLLPIPYYNRALSGNDADIVDVYHSSLPFGTGPKKLNGYPLEVVLNGGVKQPGCSGIYSGVEQNVAGFAVCAHVYAEYFFTDSIKEDFFGCPCKLPDKGFGFLPPCLKTCEGGFRVGYYLEKPNATGVYYTRTNKTYGIPPGFVVAAETVDGETSFVVRRTNR